MNRPRVYRTLSVTTKEAITTLSRALTLSESALARRIFEAALVAVESGELPIEPQPVPVKMTLFPPGEEPGWSYDPDPANVKARVKEKSPCQRPPQTSATYRVRQSTHRKMKALAGRHEVTIGNLANYFLEWGLDAYAKGKRKFSDDEH
ncbi:MAG: hypothetical protein HN855_10420 [Anaerolineae bacterium]|jgi:hypothetical protein|nr:hypothetical protein [Anaerolineae bacterium]MBT7325565.1 hypothetical protein [Anaerolineae bacterium]